MRCLPSNRSVLSTAVAIALSVVGWGAVTTSAGSRQAALTNPVPSGQTTQQAPTVIRISQQEFERLLHEGNVILVDVRDHRAYLQAHLPEAVSIPLDQLEASLPRLRAANARIVLYCGALGLKSGRAAELLRAHGFERVYCLDGGFDRWVDSGRVVIVPPTDG